MKKISDSYTTSRAEGTQKMGAMVAGHLCAKKRKSSVVLCLYGELGSGKTTFAQGFARELGVLEKVLSPTFTIVKSYPITSPGCDRKVLYHIDCYRLSSAQELLDLGWDTIISSPEHIILIEWPDRIQEVLPKKRVAVYFEAKSPREREIHVVDAS